MPVDVDTGRLAAREGRQRLRRLLRGDLDRILLKTLRKEPERRYGSAARLVEDLERHLEGQPVEARADSAGSRLLPQIASIGWPPGSLLRVEDEPSAVCRSRFRLSLRLQRNQLRATQRLFVSRHMGQFAADYKRHFDELPSQTRARSGGKKS